MTQKEVIQIEEGNCVKNSRGNYKSILVNSGLNIFVKVKSFDFFYLTLKTCMAYLSMFVKLKIEVSLCVKSLKKQNFTFCKLNIKH